MTSYTDLHAAEVKLMIRELLQASEGDPEWHAYFMEMNELFDLHMAHVAREIETKHRQMIQGTSIIPMPLGEDSA